MSKKTSVITSSYSQSATPTHEDLKELEKQFKELITKEGEKFDKKIQEKETRLTEILAVFVALFTFLSLNVTIFTRVSDAQTAVWIIGMLTVFFTFFISFLLLVLNPDKPSNWKLKIGLILSILTLAGLLYGTRFLDFNPKLNPPLAEKENSQIINNYAPEIQKMDPVIIDKK